MCVARQVVGEEEKKARLVNVRTRDNHVHGMHSLERVVDVLLQERGSRSITSSFGEGSSGLRVPQYFVLSLKWC